MEDIYAPEAESSVICSCLTANSDVFDEIARTISAGDFYDHKNAMMFDCIGRIMNAGQEPNEVTLADELRKINCLDTVGGLPSIFDMVRNPCSPLTGLTASKIVRKKSRARQLERMYKMKLENLKEGSDLADITSSTESEIRKIMADSGESNTLESASKELKGRLHSMMDGTYVSNTHGLWSLG